MPLRDDTDVPNSLDDHNVHRRDTDVSLSSKLCIRVHRSVRSTSLLSPFSALTMVGVIQLDR